MRGYGGGLALTPRGKGMLPLGVTHRPTPGGLDFDSILRHGVNYGRIGVGQKHGRVHKLLSEPTISRRALMLRRKTRHGGRSG